MSARCICLQQGRDPAGTQTQASRLPGSAGFQTPTQRVEKWRKQKCPAGPLAAQNQVFCKLPQSGCHLGKGTDLRDHQNLACYGRDGRSAGQDRRRKYKAGHRSQSSKAPSPSSARLSAPTLSQQPGLHWSSSTRGVPTGREVVA